MSTTEDRQRRMRALMDRLGVDEGKAAFIVDLADGKTKGDIVGLTDEERRRMGLDRSLTDLEPVTASPPSRVVEPS